MSDSANITPSVNKRKSSSIGRILWLINIIAAFALGLSYLAPYVSPASFWYVAFLGLGYPYLLIINFLFLLLWLFRTRLRFLLSLFIILLGWQHLTTLVQFNFKSTPTEDESLIKVMTYNVRLFDLYNWFKNNETKKKIFDLLTDESPDIICFQEFYEDDTGIFHTRDTMVKFLEANNVHVEYTHYNEYKKKNHYWGVATFSKYSIVNKGKIKFATKSNNICIYTDLLINNDTVRVYNMHLQSIHLNYADYKFMDEVMTNKETKEIERSKNILRRIKKGFIKRTEQVNLVTEHMKDCKYPIIACGDFNDTPTSYTYHSLKKNLDDCFVESGYGLGRTYDRRFLTSARIDYILKSPAFESFETRTIREDLSDHYPVVTYLKLDR